MSKSVPWWEDSRFKPVELEGVMVNKTIFLSTQLIEECKEAIENLCTMYPFESFEEKIQRRRLVEAFRDKLNYLETRMLEDKYKSCWGMHYGKNNENP